MIFTKDSIPVQDLGGGVSRKVLPPTERLMAVEVRFAAGGIGEPHAHADHDQVTYVLSGRFEVAVGGETAVLGPGEGFTADRGILHGVRALEEGALLDCFTPIREEFLRP